MTENKHVVHCTYQQLENGIHIFRVLKSTRRAVDEYLAKLDELFEAHDKTQPFRFFVDIRPDGMPSFAYTMQQSRQFLQRVHLEDKLPPEIRVVYLHDNSPIMNTMDIFLAAMRIRSSRLILNGDQETLAIDWLLSDRSARELHPVADQERL